MGEGLLKLNYGHFDPTVVIKECVDLMGLEARKKGLKLITEFERGLPEYCAY